MRSKEQVAQSFKIVAKIVVANIANDDSNTVENDVQLEKPLSEVVFLTQPTFNSQIGASLMNTVRHPTTCLVDTAVGPDLISEEYIKHQWKCHIKRL